MQRQLKLYILSILFVLMSGLFTIDAQANSAIDNTVKSNLGNTNYSVSIRELSSGNLLYENKGNNPIKPASTLKLLTSAAALDILGENYTFTTEVLTDGKVKDGILYGNLYLRGEGDPTLQVKDFVTFSYTLKSGGIKQVNGNIYADDSWFTGAKLTPGIVPEDETYYYAAPITALTLSPNDDYDASTVIVTANGSKVGAAPSISAVPNTSGLQLINNAKTVGKGSKNTLKIVRKHNTNQVVISGNIPLGSSTKEWATMQHPTLSTLYSFKSALVTQGIKFSKDSTIGYLKTPPTAESIAVKKSQTLKQLMPKFLKLSNNSIADILVKTLGKTQYDIGDWEHGLIVLNEYGESIGLNMENWQLEDGSGMSHKNKVSANEQTLLLVNLKQAPFYPVMLSSLPVAGNSDRLIGGTLKNRFTQAPFRDNIVAKTGSLDEVSTLAGYAKGKSGKWVTFSILVEHKNNHYRNQIDTIVKKIITTY
ncbi:D-alanyl-D-alanine carboxypeptidase/D-alanyl-D-alanine endopeptidase [Lysinibacillus antri]|uniref:D-alanyl-D-alanine carboxypeptidase/D-alanyl-D-alanine-endopeptidase n=1 Tax=Lysinibacillus antri TaxID=2498145 RepID=A0A432LGE7_9BACI|nr:D-alanyl-D-alanine carboxypeptidase/D-alanyl-D-alanine-endopeptidase [Lysinibacillus antri]RUL57019.1 D-alanyl-D-alanine carboxypeptidase/D-alanyl-D-alanine-endopeptidase [Lysinibacillus antri]